MCCAVKWQELAIATTISTIKIYLFCISYSYADKPNFSRMERNLLPMLCKVTAGLAPKVSELEDYLFLSFNTHLARWVKLVKPKWVQIPKINSIGINWWFLMLFRLIYFIMATRTFCAFGCLIIYMKIPQKTNKDF